MELHATHLPVWSPQAVHPSRAVRLYISRYGPPTSCSMRSYTSSGLRECSRRGARTSWRTLRESRTGLPLVPSKHISGLLRVMRSWGRSCHAVRFDNAAGDFRDDLRDDGIAEGAQLSHSGGYPIIHAATAGVIFLPNVSGNGSPRAAINLG